MLEQLFLIRCVILALALSAPFAIARDADTLLHANAFHMAVAVEPAAEAVKRIAADGSTIRAVRRLPNAPADVRR